MYVHSLISIEKLCVPLTQTVNVLCHSLWFINGLACGLNFLCTQQCVWVCVWCVCGVCVCVCVCCQ